MSDLLSEHLGQAALEKDSKSKSSHHPVSTITQWLQCFAVYTAVIHYTNEVIISTHHYKTVYAA